MARFRNFPNLARHQLSFNWQQGCIFKHRCCDRDKSTFPPVPIDSQPDRNKYWKQSLWAHYESRILQNSKFHSSLKLTRKPRVSCLYCKRTLLLNVRTCNVHIHVHVHINVPITKQFTRYLAMQQNEGPYNMTINVIRQLSPGTRKKWLDIFIKAQPNVNRHHAGRTSVDSEELNLKSKTCTLYQSTPLKYQGRNLLFYLQITNYTDYCRLCRIWNDMGQFHGITQLVQCWHHDGQNAMPAYNIIHVYAHTHTCWAKCCDMTSTLM